MHHPAVASGQPPPQYGAGRATCTIEPPLSKQVRQVLVRLATIYGWAIMAS